LNEARKIGVSAPKLDLLPAWRETTIYSVREAAALAFTERITLIAGHPIEDETWVEVRTHFSEAEVALLTTAIAQINFWNRIAAPLRFTPPIPVHSEPLANS
jgi:alkylhydroperoxidase family enzyme